MEIKEIIETLKIIQAIIEWDYSLDHVIAIDEAIEILKGCEKGERENKV